MVPILGIRRIAMAFCLVTGLSCEDLTAQESVNNMHPAVSPDGRHVVFESDRMGMSGIFIMNIDGSDVRQLTENSSNNTLPGWFPDGTRITFQSDREERRQPWPWFSMSHDGSDVRRMEDLSVVFDRISPDGSSVLTSEKIDGNTDIFISSRDGANKRRLTDDPAFDSDMEFSPDGGQIVYESFVGDLSTAEVIVMERDGSGKTTVAHGTDPGWSPDGQKIIYKARDQAGECCNIYIMNRDGSGKMMLAEHGYFQQFVPNGDRIIYFALAGDAYQIFGIKPNGAGRQQLTQP